MSLIPALRKQEDLCEFEASLVCGVNSKIVEGDTGRKPVLKNKPKPK